MSENTINRRKVAMGLAWSAPTIAAVAAAPFSAASPTLCDNSRRIQEWTRAILTTPGLGWNEGTNELTFTAEDETFNDQESVNAILTITNTNGGVTVQRAEGTAVSAGEMSSATVSTVIADLSQISAITGSVQFSKTPGTDSDGLLSYDSVMLSFDDATCSVGEGTPSPETCNTRDLWMNQIPENGFHPTSIDADGKITITKPQNWESPWPTNITVSYIGTNATATITQEGDAVIATPPAGVDPFDIERIESQAPGSDYLVYRQTDGNGNYFCSLSTGASGVS